MLLMLVAVAALFGLVHGYRYSLTVRLGYSNFPRYVERYIFFFSKPKLYAIFNKIFISSVNGSFKMSFECNNRTQERVVLRPSNSTLYPGAVYSENTSLSCSVYNVVSCRSIFVACIMHKLRNIYMNNMLIMNSFFLCLNLPIRFTHILCTFTHRHYHKPIRQGGKRYGYFDRVWSRGNNLHGIKFYSCPICINARWDNHRDI